MDTTEPPDRAVTADVSAYKRKAKRLFEDEILGRWKNARNVWRTAWAMDTILDYFTVCGVDGSEFGSVALGALDPMKKGNWWDDFGWIGIAALRAADQDMSPLYRERFVKIAINAWAYMYGPGWSKTSKLLYPFMGAELPGWADFASTHQSSVGAPNVWNAIDRTFNPPSLPPADFKFKQQPRFSPGGAWNSPIEKVAEWEKQTPIFAPPQSVGSENYLNPVQNSVTNGLYAILTLRIYQASRNPSYNSIFDASGLDAAACLQAWDDQITWLGHWMLDISGDQSLLLEQGFGPLVRERVSTFHAWNGLNYWDAAYRKNLVWTGDQGLFIGALREGAIFVRPNPAPPVSSRYAGILAGTFNQGFANRSYGSDGSIKGNFPLPWLDLAAQDRYNAAPPGDDTPDYQTGVGVFMRYLLQAYQADPAVLSDNHKQVILAMADQVVISGFGTNAMPAGACDAFTPMEDGDETDAMTAYVNHLSVLLLAIAISSKV